MQRVPYMILILYMILLSAQRLAVCGFQLIAGSTAPAVTLSQNPAVNTESLLHSTHGGCRYS